MGEAAVVESHAESNGRQEKDAESIGQRQDLPGFIKKGQIRKTNPHLQHHILLDSRQKESRDDDHKGNDSQAPVPLEQGKKRAYVAQKAEVEQKCRLGYGHAVVLHDQGIDRQRNRSREEYRQAEFGEVRLVVAKPGKHYDFKSPFAGRGLLALLFQRQVDAQRP